MEVVVVLRGRWRVMAPGSKNEQGIQCDLIEQFEEFLSSNYESNANGLLVLLDRITKSERGPFALPSGLMHEVDKKLGIYELIKGDLRLFFFVADGSIMVCHAIQIKKGQKVDKKLVNQVSELKKNYEAASRTSAGIRELEGDRSVKAIFK